MPSIREWPVATRPRERLLERGASACSDVELLAILIGSGRRGRSAIALAQETLIALGGLRELARADPTRIASRRDRQARRGPKAAQLGPATAARVLAALELGGRVVAARESDVSCATPEHAARALAPYFARCEREELKVALLTRKQRLLEVKHVYSGTVSGTNVRLAELFTEAVRRQASCILIAHNHPSGDPSPSGDDLRTTAEAVSAGRLLGIEVVDHLVFGAGRWVSLRGLGVCGLKGVAK